jgi:hypothetical protein
MDFATHQIFTKVKRELNNPFAVRTNEANPINAVKISEMASHSTCQYEEGSKKK